MQRQCLRYTWYAISSAPCPNREECALFAMCCCPVHKVPRCRSTRVILCRSMGSPAWDDFLVLVSGWLACLLGFSWLARSRLRPDSLVLSCRPPGASFRATVVLPSRLSTAGVIHTWSRDCRPALRSRPVPGPWRWSTFNSICSMQLKLGSRSFE